MVTAAGRQQRSARVLRGLLAGAVATVVAGLSHVIGGGPAPSSFVVIVALAGSIALGIVLGGGPLRLGRLAAMVTGGQALYHALFSLVPATGAAVVAGGGHHGSVVIDASGLTTSLVHSGPVMMLAHGVAAAATIAALHFGVVALAGIAAVVLVVVRTLRAAVAVAVAPSRRFVGAWWREPRRPLARFSLTISGRGPPRFAAARLAHTTP